MPAVISRPVTLPMASSGLKSRFQGQDIVILKYVTRTHQEMK